MRAASSPALAGNLTQTLFVIRAANMTLTTDQALTKVGAFTNYVVTNVVGVAKSGAFGTACLGGIYTGAGKTGDTLLAAAQSWANLTGVGLGVVAPAANILQKQESATPILALTTGNTGALTADIFVQGIVTD